jgi:hypothetical protein
MNLGAVSASARAGGKKRESEAHEPYLSARMRGSWKKRQFWSDYGIRKSFDVDAIGKRYTLEAQMGSICLTMKLGRRWIWLRR